MAACYILDGYNVIKQTSGFYDLKLRQARESLIRLLENSRALQRRKAKVTVVFDGREDVCNYKLSHSINVIFSKGQTADAVIKDLVESSTCPRNITVVSDDKGITCYTRQLRSSFVSVKDFLNNIVRKPPKKDNSPDKIHYRDKVLETGFAKKVNEELTEIWLKKKT